MIHPKEELKELKSYIKLTNEQAEKRDLLEKFFKFRDKVLYLDADSLVFHAVYKCVEYSELKDALSRLCREDVEEYIIKVAIDRFDEQLLKIMTYMEESEINIVRTIYFFTTCKNNWRNEIDPTYKADRKKTNIVKWVGKVKEELINQLKNGGQIVFHSDTLEADDLISELVRDSPRKDRIIVGSIDKDLKQLPCCHFDYYQKKIYDEETGEEFKHYKGFSYTSPQEGYDMLMEMLLIGDSVDNIKGVKGIGPKKAKKLLEDKNNFTKLVAVARAYNDMDRLRTNIKLMKL